MRVYRDAEIQAKFYAADARAHPWTHAEHDPAHRYVDFKVHPDQVSATLLDFRPWSEHHGVQSFFELIRRLNDSDSVIETNDCGFRGPHENSQNDAPCGKPHARRADGRIMILWRDLRANLDMALVEWLIGAIEHYAKQIDDGWHHGVIALGSCPAVYLDVDPDTEGSQVWIHFWLWGDSDDEVLIGLRRLSDNLQQIFEQIARQVRETAPKRE